MTVRKRKKVRKQRGSRTYGYGRVSGGHRKGGSRGGKGNAGIKNHHRIGRISDVIKSQKGFTVPTTPSTGSSINVGDIDAQFDALIDMNIAKKKGSVIKIDVTDLGYSKVMGKGRVSHPFHLYAEKITPRAQEKIKAAGGKTFPSSSQEEDY
ncbi:MAG: uL15 family ribosomal protein [Candidatus Heimdallarchaeota archaeon]|nr:MAG: uL15 family ribosomal protein [Candidatus Heimdallarchaeota archaeon]